MSASGIFRVSQAVSRIPVCGKLSWSVTAALRRIPTVAELI